MYYYFFFLNCDNTKKKTSFVITNLLIKFGPFLQSLREFVIPQNFDTRGHGHLCSLLNTPLGSLPKGGNNFGDQGCSLFGGFTVCVFIYTL